MPASTPWWSTPSIAAPRPGRRPTLGLAAAIVASVLSGAAMADPPPHSAPPSASSPAALPAAGTAAWTWVTVAPPSRDLASSALPYAVYPMPYGLDRGTCDRGLLAKELTRGATAVSSAKSKSPTASVSSIAVSPLVGSIIGRSMDAIDQYCVSQILEYAPDRARIHWYGDPGVTYGVTPLSTFERDGRYCREFHTAAQIDGRNERVYGVACRAHDGTWQVMS